MEEVAAEIEDQEDEEDRVNEVKTLRVEIRILEFVCWKSSLQRVCQKPLLWSVCQKSLS